MAAPNLINATTATGKTAYATPSNTSANILLANAASSGKVLKVNMVIAANVDGTATYAATVAINSKADGSGTSYPMGSTLDVPAKASIVVSDKNSVFYLEEDRSLVVTSGSASKIAYTVSYEEIS